jgi:hypothetical protein
MAKETDWGKHGVIAAWAIGVPTLIIALVSYVRPADPAHPMSFDSWSRPIAVPPWLIVSSILLVLIIFALTLRSRIRRPVSQTSITPPVSLPMATAPVIVKLDMHPTSLDGRVTDPKAQIGYTAKLRLSLENAGAQPVRILAPKWLTGAGNISVQCGASPFPNIPYQEGMMEFSYRYQMEKYKGSWKLNEWRRLANGKDDEVLEITVDPGQSFRIWIGLNPCVPHKTLEDLRKTHNLGTLILPAVIGNQECEWKSEI